jgi:hypothetical protein
MAQDPSIGGACILDSTSNTYQGTPHGSMTSNDLIDGLVGKALDFDGIDDYIDCGDIAILNSLKTNTVEAFMNLKDQTNYAGIVAKSKESSDNYAGFILQNANPDTTGTFRYFIGGSTQTSVSTNSNLNQYCYLTGTVDKNNTILYYDGIIKDNAPTNTSYTLNSSGYSLKLANISYTDIYADIILAEVRISNITRSANWIKATNYTLRDSIVYYYATENYTPEGPTPSYYFHGWVKEQGAPSQKPLYLYRRDTGELMDKTTSDEAGFYQLESAYNIEHFIVVLDTDNKDPQYEPLISDKLLPNEKN